MTDQTNMEPHMNTTNETPDLSVTDESLFAFNQQHGTRYSKPDLIKFNNYKDHYGLPTKDALTYIQSCHNCNSFTIEFASEYCCGSCHNYVEELGVPCFRGESCLICTRDQAYRQLPEINSDLKELAEFYKKHYTNTYYCRFIESISPSSQTNEQRIELWKKLKAYSAKAYISEYDACRYEYVEKCHCCRQDLASANALGQVYCSDECEDAIENCGYNCAFENCLICQNLGTESPPFLERIKKFWYLIGYDDDSGYGVNSFKELEDFACDKNLTLLEAYELQCQICQPILGDFANDDTIENLSTDDKTDLYQYAHDYGAPLLRALHEQHFCKSCDKEVIPCTFGPSHQFCGALCELLYTEKPHFDYCTRCKNKKENCPVCDGRFYYVNQRATRKEAQLKQNEPVLATILVFKNLMVYNQLYDSIVELVEYVG